MIEFALYSILIITTIISVFVSIYSFCKLKSLFIIFPIWIIYFWSLFGVWSWIPFKNSGKVHYIENELFHVNIDSDYLISVSIYCIFILLFNLSVFLYVKYCYMKDGDSEIATKRSFLDITIKLSKSRGYLYCLYFFWFIFIYFSFEDIYKAVLDGGVIYKLSRFDSDVARFVSLKQFCGDCFVFLLIPIIEKIKNWNFLNKILIVVMIVSFFMFNFLLGNRNILFVAIFLYFMLYVELNGLRKIFNFKNMGMFILLLLMIQTVYFLREVSITNLMQGNYTLSLDAMLGSFSGSSEKYAAHFSMYGIINKNVPYTYGSSLLFLASTLIPSFFGVGRPLTIYKYYIVNFDVAVQKGFTINHITAWFMNFGFCGVFLGSVIWAMILLRFHYISRKNNSPYYFYAYCLFSIASIQMIRGGGPESYKGALLLGTFIPCFIIYICSKFKLKIK